MKKWFGKIFPGKQSGQSDTPTDVSAPPATPEEIKAIIFNSMHVLNPDSRHKLTYHEGLQHDAEHMITATPDKETKAIARKLADDAIDNMARYYGQRPDEWRDFQGGAYFSQQDALPVLRARMEEQIGEMLMPARTALKLPRHELAERVTRLKSALQDSGKPSAYERLKSQVRESPLHAKNESMTEAEIEKAVDNALGRFASHYEENGWHCVSGALQKPAALRLSLLPEIEKRLFIEINRAPGGAGKDRE